MWNWGRNKSRPHSLPRLPGTGLCPVLLLLPIPASHIDSPLLPVLPCAGCRSDGLLCCLPQAHPAEQAPGSSLPHLCSYCICFHALNGTATGYRREPACRRHLHPCPHWQHSFRDCRTNRSRLSRVCLAQRCPIPRLRTAVAQKIGPSAPWHRIPG